MGMPEDLFDKAVSLLKQAKNNIVLTGAGVSTESGIPDFRGKGGLWSRYDPFEYGTMGSFLAKPEKVWRMLATLLEVVDAQPNEGHHGLAELEQMGLLQGIITQNIDGLHQKGGSRNVVEFHGSLDTFTCLACGAQFGLAAVKDSSLPPCCTVCHSILKPDIVFFDEVIPEKVLTLTEQMLASADLLLVAGTSCQVQPAASIPFMVFNKGGRIIEINKEPALSHIATVTLQGSFSAVMRELVQRLKS
jgi:NAD-dependent deacetylase